MAEQGKIQASDLIADDVIKRVQELQKELEGLLGTVESVAKTAIQLDSALKNSATTQEQVSKNIQKTKSENEKLNAVEREVIKIEKQKRDLAVKIAAEQTEAHKQLVKLREERKKQNDLIKEEVTGRKAENEALKTSVAQRKAEEKAQREQTKASESLEKQRQKALEKLMLEQEKLKAAEGSYKQLDLRLKQATKDYKELSEAERKGTKGQTILKVIQDTDTQLKDLDASMGVHTRNVGNYQSALENLPGPFANVLNGAKALGQQFLSLLSNPIVAMIAAITLALQQLYVAFKRTDSGATEIDARLKQLSAALDVYFSRLVKAVEVAVDIARAFKNLFSGNFKQAFEEVKKAASDWISIFTGVVDQFKNATGAAYDYAYALDAIEDAENNYISERANNLNKIAKLEAEAADRGNTIQKRRDALKEAMKLSEEEVKIEKGFIDQRLQAELNYLAARSETGKKVTAEQIRQFIMMSDEQQANASESLKIVRNNYQDKFKELEELYAKSIEADTKYFEENKKNIAKLSQFELEILMQRLRNEQGFIEKKLILSKENSQEELNNTILFLNKKREIELMDINQQEGEKAKINADYDKQIIEASKKRAEYVRKQNIIEVEARLIETEKGSLRELELQEELLTAKFIADLDNTDYSESEKAKIIAQYNRDLISNSEAVATKQVNLLDQQLNNEMQAITEQYLNREIKEGEFSQKLLDMQIAMLEKEVDINDLATEQKIALQEKLTNFKLQKFNEEKQAQEELMQYSTEIANSLFELGSALRERETAELEAEKQYRLSLVGDDAKERERIEKEYQAKANQIKRRQAISDKISALFQIALNTAMGITNALSKVVTTPLVPIIAAAGAVQAAVVASRPIPKFAKGVTDFEGGLAEVGEAGREMIELPTGKTFLTPDKATKMLLPKGSNVYTHNETEEMLRNGVSAEKFDEMIKEQKETRKALSNKIENHTTLTQGGFEYGIRKGGTKIKLIDKYFRG